MYSLCVVVVVAVVVRFRYSRKKNRKKTYYLNEMIEKNKYSPLNVFAVVFVVRPAAAVIDAGISDVFVDVVHFQ